MKDREVIKAFVEYLRNNGYPDIRIERWPEDEIRNSQEIDALAGIFAIEHTSIDSIPNQRRDSDWFIQVVGGLEEELSHSMSFRLRITLHYDAVARGQNWSNIRNSVKYWITHDAPHIADGTHIIEDISEVPFRIYVTKASDRPPGLYFARIAPADATLVNRLRKQLDRKAKKLQKYKLINKTTVLLVENDDIALMNDAIMHDAINKAYPHGPPNGVDQIWYADTSIPSEIQFTEFTINSETNRMGTD
jgi:hypothetical protein